MSINLQSLMEIEDILTEKKTQENIYKKYLRVIDSIEQKGNQEELMMLYEEMDMTLERMENTEKDYIKKVKPCKHIKINFGGGYEKCLLCETEDKVHLAKWFGNDKIPTIYVETLMKKYGKCFEYDAREKVFTIIKDMFIDILIQLEANNQPVDERKILYNIAVETHGYTGPVKKIRSRKIN